ENLSRSVRRFAAAHGYPGLTPHVLRHTYCTLLCAAGVDLRTIQYLMGHSDPQTTMKVYTHYVQSNGEQAAGAIDAMMNDLPTTNIIQLGQPVGRWGISAKAV
ncbi:MAG: tyrosine-type recombinase/integrase, partial [Eggerthellaceae bacterium]|nr:tyrosine-type recombinase/integrase [Eggerthellaceae bacterium]